MVDVKKFLDKDLYGLMGIDISAEEADVSLTCRYEVNAL